MVFHPLDQQQIRLIAGMQLEMLHKRLGHAGLDMEISDAALDLLAEAGFDPVYGARPLKRAIQQQIENPLAQSILSASICCIHTQQSFALNTKQHHPGSVQAAQEIRKRTTNWQFGASGKYGLI